MFFFVKRGSSMFCKRIESCDHGAFYDHSNVFLFENELCLLGKSLYMFCLCRQFDYHESNGF